MPSGVDVSVKNTSTSLSAQSFDEVSFILKRAKAIRSFIASSSRMTNCQVHSTCEKLRMTVHLYLRNESTTLLIAATLFSSTSLHLCSARIFFNLVRARSRRLVLPAASQFSWLCRQNNFGDH